MKPANNGFSKRPDHELVESFEYVNGINAIIRPRTGTDISSQGVCRFHALALIVVSIGFLTGGNPITS